MKVRAKFGSDEQFGFYGTKVRNNGDVFELEDPAHFSKIWMVKMDEPEKPRRGRRPAHEIATDEGEEGAE